MRLYLARHGQTTSNTIRALDTAAPGADLTETGRVQSEELAERMTDIHLDGILVSHLVRTQQTAEPIATSRKLDPRIDPRIAEVSAGDWEMANDMPTLMEYFGIAQNWMEGDLDPRIPGGENGHEVLERFNAAIEESDEESLLVVSHGMMLQVWATIMVGDPAGEKLPHMTNCATGVIEGTPGKWELVDWYKPPTPGTEVPAEDVPKE